jgi:hypothetical protein
MTSHTNESTVTFKQQFNLSSLDGPQPAGTYRLVVENEEIPGMSFIAYRRTSTMLHLPALTASAGKIQVFSVDRDELEAVLKMDQRLQSTGQT